MPTDEIKKSYASVENYGDITGNYAQLTPIALEDLKLFRGVDKKVSFEQVMNDPALYDQMVDLYYDRMGDFGVPDDLYTRVIWWRAPTLYKKTGGDISKIEDPKLRNIMENRVKNIYLPAKYKALMEK